MIIRHILPAAVLILLIMGGCKNQGDHSSNGGHIVMQLKHTIDNQDIDFDELMYINQAGNQYMVTEIQWFLSDLTLHRSEGESIKIIGNDGCFYVDTDLQGSLLIAPAEIIPAGTYTGISFTFGINEQKNVSGLFVNPPESFMFWPEYLGGGYHYMKLNGKWINPEGQTEPFNFHLGIGQEYAEDTGKAAVQQFGESRQYDHCEGYQPPQKLNTVAGFIQNYFSVEFNDLNFTITDGSTQSFELEMKVENWFKSPHVYDHNQWGGSIMQQQEAMQLGCENGRNVFVIRPLQ